MYIFWFLTAFTLTSFVFPAGGMAEVHKRSNWYIGFGIGAGLDARYEINGEEVTFGDWFKDLNTLSSKFAANFKVGVTLSPKTLLGLDITSVDQTAIDNGSEVTLSIYNFLLMFTHFPHKEGFFIRGGGGLSNIDTDITAGAITYKTSVEGYGLLGGIGYAYWLKKRFNLTINLDHSRQFYSGGTDVPDNSQFTILYVGFDWY